MSNKEITFGKPVKGLNTDINPSDIEGENSYTYALNARQESEDGNLIIISNEPSNTKYVDLSNYHVLGVKNIVELNKTFLFVINKTTNISEIGYFTNEECCDDLEEDYNNPCDECEKNPITKEPHQFSNKFCNNYQTIVSAECLNFSVDFPIHQIEYKITHKSIELYWTDGNNPMRWIDLEKIPLVNNQPNTLDCNAIRVFPHFNIPVVEATDTFDTGSLKAGVYQFFVSYSNSKGEEISQYYPATNPTAIWNNIHTNLMGFDTNKSINIRISELDKRFKYFNLAVGKTVNSTTEFELIGTFPINIPVMDYLYTGNNKVLRSLSVNDIFFKYPFYETANTVASQNNIIMWGDLTSPEEISYQKIANQISLQWESIQLLYNEFEKYNKGTNTANYRGYLRDEVYSFEIVFVLKSGRLTAKSHIPGPAPKPAFFTPVNNQDALNVKNNPCDEPVASELWNIYNTATKIGFSPEYNPNDSCYIGPYEYGDFGYYQSSELYPDNIEVWGNLANTPIRHHKFPPVERSPIFDINTNYEDLNFAHKIYPLGVKVNNQNVIDAINNSDLTQSQKDDIVGFYILRSSRTNNNSIIAKGLLHNVGISERDEETYYFPNYPYNDLREDPFLSTQQPKPNSGGNDGNPVIELQDDRICYEDSRVWGITYPFNPMTSINLDVEEGDEDDNTNDPLYHVTGNIVLNGQSNNIQFAFYSRYEENDNNPKKVWSIEFADSPVIGDISINLPTQTLTASVEYVFLKIPIIIDRCGFLQPACRRPVTYIGMWFRVENNLLVYDDGLVSEGELEDVSFPLSINNTTTNVSFGTYPFFTVRMTPQGQNKLNNRISKTFCVLGEKLVNIGSPSGDIRLNGFISPETKKRMVFHSPNTHFMNPAIGGFLKLESVYHGKAKAQLSRVKDESKQAIATKFTVRMATAMAVSTVIKVTLGAGTFGWPNINFGIESVAPVFIQTLDMLEKLVPLKEYALQYLSVGNYSNYKYPVNGNKIRSLELGGYIKPGIQAIGDDHPINNFQRESSVYLKLNSELPFPHEVPGVPQDVSRFNYNSYFHETAEVYKTNQKIFRNISSYYGAIKRVYPDQYGRVFSQPSVLTGRLFMLDKVNLSHRFLPLFGGDTFINRFAYKSKIPFFLDNKVGFPDKSDVVYDLIGNVAYPTYWVSSFPIEVKLSRSTIQRANAVFREVDNFKKAGNILKNFTTGGAAGMVRFIGFAISLGNDIRKTIGIKNVNLDAHQEVGIHKEGYFYLFAYGIPYFFVESDVNVDYRQAENNLEKDFFPNVGTDIPEFWLQEKNVSINHDNYYLYNRDFSKQNTEGFFYALPEDFDKQIDSITNLSTRVIWSEQYNLEEIQNNWTVYKANNYYDFPFTYGKLISLDALDGERVLTRFENNFSIYNAYVTIDTDSKTAIVGSGSMFANPPQEYSNTNVGYGGSQNKCLVKCKYGYFWVDAKRGEIFHLLPAGQGVQEISAKGMRNWFKENLPFKALKYNPEENIDNNFKEVGITMVWDNRYERLFITKKDYSQRPSIDPAIPNEKIDTSWTIAYAPKTESWVSYYSFLPKYYIEQQNYFLSGIEGSLWCHLKTNKSYQTFYNEFYDFVVEAINKVSMQEKTLTSLIYKSDALRYTNNVDYKLMNNITFNECIIYNDLQLSGKLSLEVKDKKDLSLIDGKYDVNTNKVVVKVTNFNNTWKLNSFYNIIKNNNSLEEMFLNNPAHSNKNINENAVDYLKYNTPFNRTRITSDWCKVRLINSTHQRYKFLFKWLISKNIKKVL